MKSLFSPLCFAHLCVRICSMFLCAFSHTLLHSHPHSFSISHTHTPFLFPHTQRHSALASHRFISVAAVADIMAAGVARGQPMPLIEALLRRHVWPLHGNAQSGAGPALYIVFQTFGCLPFSLFRYFTAMPPHLKRHFKVFHGSCFFLHLATLTL